MKNSTLFKTFFNIKTIVDLVRDSREFELSVMIRVIYIKNNIN